MSESDPIELAEKAKKPGTFNIVSAIKHRGYPQDEVNIYLDEDTAFKAALVKDELSKIDELDSEYAATKKKLDDLLLKLEESKYVFSIKGISEGKREEINKIATDKYPLEYREDKNVYTGEIKREEIDNVDRDNLFTSLLWSEHIDKIVAPNGDIQDKLMPEDALEIRNSLPIAATALINKSIENVRTATAVFMISVDEDFLAKS
jgi:hypothetical protein